MPRPCHYIEVHSPDPLRLVLLNRASRWDISKNVLQYGDIVQLEERRLHTATVGGSNPSFTTNNGQVAESGLLQQS